MQNLFNKYSTYIYLGLFCLGCFFPLINDPHFYYGNHIDCDTTRYFGMHLTLGQLNEFQNLYMDERLPALIPVYILYQLFSMEVAHMLNVFITYSLQIFGLYFALTQFFNKKTSLITVSLYAICPLVLGSLTTDYTANKAELYGIYSLLFMGMGLKQKKYFFYFIAAFFFAASMHSNLKYIMYHSFIPILYFTSLNTEKINLKSSLKFIGIGFLGYGSLLLLTCVLSYLLGGEFFYMKDLLSQILKDESFFRAEFLNRLRETPLTFIFVFITTLSFFNILKNKKISGLDIAILFIFVINVLYILKGGNYFVSQRSSGLNIIFFMVIAHFFVSKYMQNINLKLLPVFLIIGLYIACIILFFPQYLLVKSLGYGAILVFILIPIVLNFLFKFLDKKNLSLLSFGLIVLLIVILRPDSRGNFPWAYPNHYENGVDKRYQTYKNQYKAITYFNKFNFITNPYFIFDFAENRKREDIVFAYSGCTTYYTSCHLSLDGRKSPEPNWEVETKRLKWLLKHPFNLERHIITSGNKEAYEKVVSDLMSDSEYTIEFLESFQFDTGKLDNFHIYKIIPKAK